MTRVTTRLPPNSNRSWTATCSGQRSRPDPRLPDPRPAGSVCRNCPSRQSRPDAQTPTRGALGHRSPNHKDGAFDNRRRVARRPGERVAHNAITDRVRVVRSRRRYRAPHLGRTAARGRRGGPGYWAVVLCGFLPRGMSVRVTLDKGDDQASSQLQQVLDGYLFGATVET